MPAVPAAPVARASALGLVVLYGLPLAVLRWAGPLAWVGLFLGTVGLRWTTHPPHRRRLVLLYGCLAAVSLGILLFWMTGTDTVELR